MAEVPKVNLEDPPRMADYAFVGVAVERVLGWPPGTLLADYTEAIEAATDVAIDVSVIAPLIMKIADSGGFEGTATESTSGWARSTTAAGRGDPSGRRRT